VRFAPDCLGDYEDYMVVETEALSPLLVPLVAQRPPPILTCEFHHCLHTVSGVSVCVCVCVCVCGWWLV